MQNEPDKQNHKLSISDCSSNFTYASMNEVRKTKLTVSEKKENL